MATKLIRFAELSERGITYSRQHISRLTQAGKFPRPVKLSLERHGAIAFVETEIDEWITARIEHRDAPSSAMTPDAQVTVQS